MICPDVSIEGDDIAIDRSTIILPKVSVISCRGITTTTTTTAAAVDAAVIGRNNIIEECCFLVDSTIGDENWIGIGAHIIQVSCPFYPVESSKVLLPPHIQSRIGHNNHLSAKCKLRDCSIGSNCFIGPAIHLDSVTIADDTAVYMVDGSWRCKKADVSVLVKPHTHKVCRLLSSFRCSYTACII